MSKYAVLSLLILFRIPVVLSQNYYILSSKDSVPCQSINYFNTNAQGKMVELEFVNMQNETIKWEKNEIPEIDKISQDGVLYVKMPLKIDKPEAYYRYGRRVVSGKMIVDVFDDDVQTSYRLKENFDGSYNQQGVMKQTTEGIYIRHVKLPTGEVYEVSGLKALKSLKAIQAYMFACEAYKKEYESNPKYQTCTFEEAVADFNKMCP
jgi:competence protein ComGC